MPKRKTLPDLQGTGLDPENNVVQKTNPLLSLAETNLTLPELKLVDVYLSRIDSHAPSKRFVRFQRGELEKLLGVSQIKAADLENRIDHLFQVVTIRDPRKPRGFTKISLFEKATCYQSEEDGQWTIDLGASPSAMEYIFNPENIGYLRYRLGAVIKLKSRYSYTLFLYLEQQRHMHMVWEISINELKDVLNCHKETYATYKRFNDLILKPALNELNTVTPCRVSITPLRDGRNVTRIRFILQSMEDLEDKNQITIWSTNEATAYERYHAATEGTFSQDQLDTIIAALNAVSNTCLPDGEDDTMRRYELLSELFQRLKKREAEHKINDRCAYLVRAIGNVKPKDDKKPAQKISGKAESFDADEFMAAAMKRSYAAKKDEE